MERAANEGIKGDCGRGGTGVCRREGILNTVVLTKKWARSKHKMAR